VLFSEEAQRLDVSILSPREVSGVETNPVADYRFSVYAWKPV
jgi:hypothetical protein